MTVKIEIRKVVTYVEEIRTEGGIVAPRPLRIGYAAAVVNNPYAGVYAEDLNPIVSFSEDLGAELGRRLVEVLGVSPPEVECYGKAAVVGVNGEQEHANAFLTTLFGNSLRNAVGGGKAWIPSNTKRAGCGAAIDVPLAYKNALWVRSHYNSVVAQVPDAPGPNEVLVVVAGATGPRLNARLGGLRKEEVVGEDGLR